MAGFQGCNRNAEAKTAYESEASTATNHLLYILIQEYPELCSDTTKDTEKLGERLFWITEETLRNRESVEALGSKLDTLHKDLGLEGVLDGELTVKGGFPVSVAGGAPLAVEDAAGHEYSENLVSAVNADSSSVDAVGEATKGGLWFIAGCIVALVIGFAIWRTGSLRG